MLDEKRDLGGGRSVRVALVQARAVDERGANLERALGSLEAAAGRGAQVVCFQEIFLGPYFCQSQDETAFGRAEEFPGPLSEEMGRAAARLGVVLVVPFFERRAAGVYHNSAFVVDADGEVMGLYRKMHIPDDPRYYEKYYFSPGDLGFRSWETRFGRIGVLICWDQWYPEAARLTAMEGAEVLFYPTAIGWHPGEKAARGEVQRDMWRTAQRAHAVANGVYVCAANRIGFEEDPSSPGEGIEFWGSSFVADPQGQIIGEAGVDTEETLVADLDLSLVEKLRVEWPFFRDRRTDAYAGITQRFGR